MERYEKSLYRKAIRDFEWSAVCSDVVVCTGLEPVTPAM
jgi:hypothetical protein